MDRYPFGLAGSSRLRCFFWVPVAFSVALVIAWPIEAADYGLQVDGGNWQSESTWTPAGGPPGNDDTVQIANGSPPGALTSGGVQLSADAEVLSILTGATGAATIDLNGHTLTAVGLGIYGPTTIIRDGGGLTLELLDVFGGTASIESTDVVTESITVWGADSELRINRPLELDGGIQITNSGSVTTEEKFSPLSGINLASGGELLAAQIVTQGGVQNDGGVIDVSEGLTATGNVVVYGGGVIRLNGSNLVAERLFIGQTLSAGTIDRGTGGSVQVEDLFIASGSFTYQGNDIVSEFVSVGSGTALTLDKDLTLQEDLINAGTLDLNGHTLTAELYEVAGSLERDGGSLDLERILVLGTGASLEPGDELTVEAEVLGPGGDLDVNTPLTLSGVFGVDGGSSASVNQAAGQTTGLTLNNSETALVIDDTGILELLFDAGSLPGDWTLRWSGDHLSDLLEMHADGRLTWNIEPFVDVIYSGVDDYTYVMVTVPEPGSAVLLGLGALAVSTASIWRRRKRA